MVKLKHLVPTSLRRWWYVLARLDAVERRALLAVAIDTTLQPRSRDWRVAMRDAGSVVFVCQGNIIRSPLAAAALAREAAVRGKLLEISSAGLSVRAGEPADLRAVDSAEEAEFSLDSHRARPLEAGQVAAAGAIFVMDHLNLGRMLARYPGASGKVFLLGGCRPDGTMTLTEIRDPVSGTFADVREAHEKVMAAVRLLAAVWEQAT